MTYYAPLTPQGEVIGNITALPNGKAVLTFPVIGSIKHAYYSWSPENLGRIY